MWGLARVVCWLLCHNRRWNLGQSHSKNSSPAQVQSVFYPSHTRKSRGGELTEVKEVLEVKKVKEVMLTQEIAREIIRSLYKKTRIYKGRRCNLFFYSWPSCALDVSYFKVFRLLFLRFLSTDNKLVSFVSVSSSTGSVASFASFISAGSFVEPVESVLAFLLPLPTPLQNTELKIIRRRLTRDGYGNSLHYITLHYSTLQYSTSHSSVSFV